MAFMSMPRKVRPWKRGLRGLGFDPYTATPAEMAAHDQAAMNASMQADIEARAQAAETAKRGVKIKTTAPLPPAPGTKPAAAPAKPGKASAWSLPGAKEAAMKGAADARASGGIVSASSGSSGGVLQSIAEVLGIAAPVGERIVKSIQDDRAATAKMRAERAEALRMSAMSPAERSAAQGSSMPSGSTIATVVGGIAAVGVVIVGLKWLAGAPAAAK